jgi:hypothetical protein
MLKPRGSSRGGLIAMSPGYASEVEAKMTLALEMLRYTHVKWLKAKRDHPWL